MQTKIKTSNSPLNVDLSSGCHPVCVVGRRRVRHGSIAPSVHVAQRVGNRLKLIWIPLFIVVQNGVLAGLRHTLDRPVRGQEKLEMFRRGNVPVHDGARRDILFRTFGSGEEARVVALLNNDKCYVDFAWWVHCGDRPVDRVEFDVENLRKLSVRDTVPVVEDHFGQLLVVFVLVVVQHRLHDGLEAVDHFFFGVLQLEVRFVAESVPVERGDNTNYAGNCGLFWGWVGYVRSDEHDALFDKWDFWVWGLYHVVRSVGFTVDLGIQLN